MGAFTFEPRRLSALFIIHLAANPPESSRPCNLDCQPDLTPQPTNRRCACVRFLFFLFLKAPFFLLLRTSGLFHTGWKITSLSPDLNSINVLLTAEVEVSLWAELCFSSRVLVRNHAIIETNKKKKPQQQQLIFILCL